MEPCALYRDEEFDHQTVCDLSGARWLTTILGTLLKYHEMFEGASPMHLTKSVDYAVVMEGEIEMHLDNGSCTVLRQGK